jgi:hypothetical protein
VISDNGNIFIGVNPENKNEIIIEDIRNNHPPETIAQHENDILSLLVNEAQNILWVGDVIGNIFQYMLGPRNAWKLQAKYSGFGFQEVYSLLLFGNLLFAGSSFHKVSIINTADKKVLSESIDTSIRNIDSLQICVVSLTKTYLTITGRNPAYYKNDTDLFNISKFQQMKFAKTIFSKAELHLNSIRHQFNNNSTSKELPIDKNNPKLKSTSSRKP